MSGRRANGYKCDVCNYVRKLLALAFLPAEHIANMFRHLKSKAGSDQLASYVEKTWISGLWKPADWSVLKQSVRTNNDVEGWHNRLNRHARRGQLPLYLLVAFFYKESQMVSLQARLFSDAKLRRYQRAKYHALPGNIFKLLGVTVTWKETRQHPTFSVLVQLCTVL